MKPFARGIDIQVATPYNLDNPIHRDIVAKNWASSILWRTNKRHESGKDTDVYLEARKAGRFHRELPHLITSQEGFKAAVKLTGKVYVGAIR